MSEEVPKKGKAAVVVNEGPDFRVEVQEVDVPEPSQYKAILSIDVFMRAERLADMMGMQRTMRCCCDSMLLVCA